MTDETPQPARRSYEIAALAAAEAARNAETAAHTATAAAAQAAENARVAAAAVSSMETKLEEVLVILKAFKMVGAVAKWVTTVTAGAAAAYHFIVDPIAKSISR